MIRLTIISTVYLSIIQTAEMHGTHSISNTKYLGTCRHVLGKARNEPAPARIKGFLAPSRGSEGKWNLIVYSVNKYVWPMTVQYPILLTMFVHFMASRCNREVLSQTAKDTSSL